MSASSSAVGDGVCAVMGAYAIQAPIISAAIGSVRTSLQSCHVILNTCNHQKKASVISHSGLAEYSGVSSHFPGPGFGCGDAILHDREIPADSVPADVKRVGFTRLSVRSGVR